MTQKARCSIKWRNFLNAFSFSMEIGLHSHAIFSLIFIFSNEWAWMRLSRIWRIKQIEEDVIHRGQSCNPSIYSASINESIAIGTTIAQLSCSDADLSPNTITSYAITTG